MRALKRSPQKPELLCAPGNAGIADDARTLDVAVEDIEGLLAAVEREGVDLTVVGPEVPLVAGLVDALAARGHAAFGPRAAAAQAGGLQGIRQGDDDAAGVPTAALVAWSARWRRDSRASVSSHAPGIAGSSSCKADGLAGGKGVVVADTARAGARRPGGDLRGGSLRHGEHAVVEERLAGEELLAARAVRRRARRAAGARARLQAHRRRAIRVRTPAAWAPTRR